jgi:hypothetical protein
METIVFMDKAHSPTKQDLHSAIATTYSIWEQLRNYVLVKYPKATEEWNYPGVKYGWSFRMKDKKRAIVYFLPRDKFFMVALVFGAKATQEALNSNISGEIKSVIEAAPVYAEGRGFRVNVKNETNLEDIKKLIDIKIAN